MRTSDHIQHLNNVRMRKLFHYVVLTLDFNWRNRQQDFNNDLLFGFKVKSLEDMRVSTPADLMREGVLFKFPPR